MSDDRACGCDGYSVVIDSETDGDGLIRITKIHSYDGPEYCRSEAISLAIRQWQADMIELGLRVG